MIHLMKPSRDVSYYIREFYLKTDSTYTLSNLWNTEDLKLDPNCLPYNQIKTKFGEILIRQETFKVDPYFIKFLGNHFVFIKHNQRKIIPICSHSL